MFATKKEQYLEAYELSLAQRAFVLPWFGVQAVLDPTKGRAVAGFNDAINTRRFTSALLRKLESSSEGRALLRAKPLLSTATLDVAALKLLPAGSLGASYAAFMDSHGFSPDDRAPVRFTTDADLAYVSARYRQVHDFWHVLCGLPTTVLGELALKAFEAAHTGLPSAYVSASVGALSPALGAAERAEYASKYVPWAWTAGRACGCLLSFDYEGNLAQDVAGLRQRLGILPAP